MIVEIICVLVKLQDVVSVRTVRDNFQKSGPFSWLSDAADFTDKAVQLMLAV